MKNTKTIIGTTFVLAIFALGLISSTNIQVYAWYSDHGYHHGYGYHYNGQYDIHNHKFWYNNVEYDHIYYNDDCNCNVYYNDNSQLTDNSDNNQLTDNSDNSQHTDNSENNAVSQPEGQVSTPILKCTTVYGNCSINTSQTQGAAADNNQQ